MSEYVYKTQEELTTLADTLRNLTGTTEPLTFPTDFISKCEDLKNAHFLEGTSSFFQTGMIEDLTLYDLTIDPFYGSTFAMSGKLTAPECRIIGDQAFSNKNITEVSFPKCKTIMFGAFSVCRYLSSMYFPEVTEIFSSAFYQIGRSASMSSFEISFPKCEWIGPRAFENCAITSANFPICKTIGQSAFIYCDQLTSINFPIVQEIYSAAFMNCTNLISIDLPECTYIGDYAFSSCSNLTSVSLPKCEILRSSVFYGNSKIKSINLPNCWYVGYNALNYVEDITLGKVKYCIGKGFSSLKKITMPECTTILDINAYQTLEYASFAKCKIINNYAFQNHSHLTSIYFPECELIREDAFAFCSALTEINFPKCQVVGVGAFRYCESISQVNLPMCETILESAFYGCSNITSISLPKCKFIGSYAFAKNSSLSIITLEQCHYIERNAFSGCSYLSTVILNSSKMVKYNVNADPFSSAMLFAIRSASIYVPGSLVSIYKNSPMWNQYKDMIFSLEEVE